MAPHTEQLTRPAVRLQGLTRSFDGRTVLDGVDLEIPAGQFVALLGHSGSGKSTLLRAIAGLDHKVAGSGELSAPERVSVVFQDSRLLPWRRVLDNVLLGADGKSLSSNSRRPPEGRAWRGLVRAIARRRSALVAEPRGRFGNAASVRARRRQADGSSATGSTEAAERGRAALAEVGLGGREKAWPSELSGGEAQRAALARSLVREPELLLADEPFGALDALTRIRMHGLLRDLWKRHRPSVLLVTHDVDEAIVLADRVLVLDSGRIGLDLTIDRPHPRSYRDPLLGEYRERLLAALGVTEDHA
jgi:sulfonate transport system ATP-binding protein